MRSASSLVRRRGRLSPGLSGTSLAGVALGTDEGVESPWEPVLVAGEVRALSLLPVLSVRWPRVMDAWASGSVYGLVQLSGGLEISFLRTLQGAEERDHPRFPVEFPPS